MIAKGVVHTKVEGFKKKEEDPLNGHQGGYLVRYFNFQLEQIATPLPLPIKRSPRLIQRRKAQRRGRKIKKLSKTRRMKAKNPTPTVILKLKILLKMTKTATQDSTSN